MAGLRSQVQESTMSVRCVREHVIAPWRERLEGIEGQIRLAGSSVLRVIGWGSEGCDFPPVSVASPTHRPASRFPLTPSTPHAQALSVAVRRCGIYGISVVPLGRTSRVASRVGDGLSSRSRSPIPLWIALSHASPRVAIPTPNSAGVYAHTRLVETAD